MMIRKSRVLIAAACFVVLLLFGPQRVLADEEKTFRLGGKPGSATAIVTKEALELTVETGPANKYNPAKGFSLTIGGCVLDVNAGDFSGTVQFNLKANAKEQFPAENLRSIVAKPEILEMSGKAMKTISGCTVSFGDKIEGAYHVKVELTGDVPEDFKLTSDALMEDANSDFAGLKSWQVLLIAVLIVVLIILLAASGSFIGYRHFKKRSLKQTQEQIKTAKSLETVPTVAADTTIPEPVTNPVQPKKRRVAKKENSKESSEDSTKRKKVRAKRSSSKKAKKDGLKNEGLTDVQPVEELPPVEKVVITLDSLPSQSEPVDPDGLGVGVIEDNRFLPKARSSRRSKR